MRHAPLLDPFKVQGALAPGLRSYFGGVIREPVPEDLTSLARELDDRLDPDPEADDQPSEGRYEEVAREERRHGTSTAKKANRSDRGG
jgi:hypothetical protein